MHYGYSDRWGASIADAGSSLAMPRSTAHSLARGLGWFSLALGIAEVIAPRRIARNVGLPSQHIVVQAYGWREIVTGIGLLLSRNPTPWVFARLAGDALDLATLSNAADQRNPRRGTAIFGIVAVAGVAVLDALAALGLSMGEGRRGMFVGSRERASVMDYIRDYSRRSGFPRSIDEMRGLMGRARVPEVSGSFVRSLE